ncbi:hypothetical protein [Methylobacterium sp. ID0610]|uniref:hypothetical protein n=1 Tax=Methylobacterium carpenticola TaxID=3344827 RepID=UPI00369F7FE9
MAETKKPLNPMEREENIGIKDGSSHADEAVTSSRHGTPGQQDAKRPDEQRQPTGDGSGKA